VNTSARICSVCNNENDESAVVCTHCGAWLEENPTRIVAIPENFPSPSPAPVDHPESFIDMALIPEGGVGIHIAGQFKPYYVHIYKELILGRSSEATLEAVLDLSDANAANLGVSRRHAMLRRTANGFEIVDLASRNGTWLNAERLVPNRPYPFASGSQLRMGQLRLLIMYHPVSGDTKKN
jgi:FHA domain